MGSIKPPDTPGKRSIGMIVLPLGAIIGIAVAGAILIFGVLTTLAVFHVRRKHRHKSSRKPQAEEGGNMDMDLKTAIRSTRPPEICFSRRMSFNPFMPPDMERLDDDYRRPTWIEEDDLQNQPRAKPRRLSPQKLFGASGMRDSWPLVSNIPMRLIQAQSSSNITLSTVAPPGYEIPPEPKWPKRTASRSSKSTITVSRGTFRPPVSHPYASPVLTNRRSPHRRSTSENHLSTILRSTSQRLKSAHKQTLTRTLTTLSRLPGAPPAERLPSTPVRSHTESREALIESDHDESVNSSIYETFLALTPSPKRDKFRQPYSQHMESPAPLCISDDSLCEAATPDLIIPKALSSPSKNGQKIGEQRHKIRISSAEAKDISTMIHEDIRASILATGREGRLAGDRNSLSVSAPHRISLASDPFYSEVKSSKPIIPLTQIQGPRPLYIRKATFGQEATPERPRSFVSPLRSISGNVQSPPKKLDSLHHSPSPLPASPKQDQPNPFQWSPQEAMQTRAIQTSPKRRKGHKRSNVIRISHIPRPPSVAIPEEPEEKTSPLKFQVPPNQQFQVIEPMKSPSPAPPLKEGRRLSCRPPTAATFSPSLSISILTARSANDSPTLGTKDMLQIHEPTVSVSNCYTESLGISEDEFSHKTASSSQSSMKSQQRHTRAYSNELFLFPGSTHQQSGGRLVSFPPPDLKSPNLNSGSGQRIPLFLSMLPRPLPSISTITSTPSGLHSTAATPAPPLLTVPIPGHLTGPRDDPSKRNSTLSPPRDSLHTSIMMLRRMNSDISTGSVNSSPGSPSFALHSTVSSPLKDRDDEKEAEESFRGRSRGSNNYLLMGLNQQQSSQLRNNRPRRGVEKRDSHRVYKERRKRRNEDTDSEGLAGNELTPVKEDSSPATVANGLGIMNLQYPTLSSFGTNGMTPPRENVGKNEQNPLAAALSIDFSVAKGLDTANQGLYEDEEGFHEHSRMANDVGEGEEQRWSSVMTTPVVVAARRESKMEHPSPLTPPKWGWSLGVHGGLGLAAQRLMGQGVKSRTGHSGEEKENMMESGRDARSRPVSLGLYDEDGFLRSSPDREGALERERAKSRLRD